MRKKNTGNEQTVDEENKGLCVKENGWLGKAHEELHAKKDKMTENTGNETG